MPIYEYLCEDCQTRYEHLAISGNGTARCPNCSSSRAAQQYSTFAARTGNGSSVKGELRSPSSGCACTPTTCGCH